MKIIRYIIGLSMVAGGLLIIGSCQNHNVNSENNNIKEIHKDENPVTGFFPNEVRPPNSSSCFQGAYYRKVVSSKDIWVGIEGKVKLPEFDFDEDRINPDKPEQYLDNPSVYLGGNADGQETDIGLTWEVIRKENGSISRDRKAFRPFLRRSSHDNQDDKYENAPAQKEDYWYPNDKVILSLRLIDNGVLEFTVEGEGKKFQTTFHANGYQYGVRTAYKRVNAIDQVANEGQKVEKTDTRVLNARWEYTSLYRDTDSTVVKVPMHDGRYLGMRCPDSKYFDIQTNTKDLQKGAETITIDGGIE